LQNGSSNSAVSAWVRTRLAASGRAFSATARNAGLLRAQLAFGAAWTAEAAFTVALGVVAFRDGGAEAVGLVAFARTAPAALLAPVGTTFADRFSRDRVLLLSCLIRAGATGSAAALLAADWSNVAVYALAVVATAAFRLFRPAHSALLPGLCNTPYDLSSANVVRGFLDSLSTLVGPLAAALLLALSSPTGVFVTSAALSLTSGLLLLRLPYERPPRGRPQPLSRIVHETLEGFQALARYRDVGLLIGLALVQALTQGFLYVFVVVLALEQLGMGASGVGLLTAALGAGAVASSLAASTFVSGRRLATLEGIGVMLWGLPLTLSGALPHETVVLGLMCVIGIGNALVDIGLHTLPARLVPEVLLARVFGAKASLTALSIAVGSFVTPLAIDLLGIRGALVLLGLVAPAAAVLAWQRLRAIDAAIAHRDKEIDVLNDVAMFRPLPMPAIDELAMHVDDVHVAAGQEVFRQGDHGDRFYVIEDGEAEVLGDGRLIRALRSGDGFGEIALLHDTLRTATVRARTPLRLYTLDRHHFLSAVTGYESSEREADALVLDRLSAFNPAH
jgi:Cyclic nucleotide-binding domain/Major Facilitator Superfamily